MRYLLLLSALVVAQPSFADAAGDRWFSHVKVLADDNMEGRLTGSPGYDRAAAYVSGQFQKLGLKPAGVNGYLQPVALKEQRIDIAQSKLALDGVPLVIGEQVLLGTRVPQLPTAFDAPLVFLGYGLHLPDSGHDDFAGQDLKGKIVVTLAGKPNSISGALASHARSAELWPAMQKAGAIGLVTIANPSQMDVPWARQKLSVATPGMRLADPALNDAKQPFLTAAFSPAEAEMLFAGSGTSFAEILKKADAGENLPAINLNKKLSGEVFALDRELSSPNVVGLLPGSDPKLAGEYVVLSAHLDHVGVDKPVNGDSIYNGAMDNASGIATMIEVGRELVKAKPKRSVLFVAVTGEERGLLGSRFNANKPTVDPKAVVANINMDMYLPLWPFTTVTALGSEDSSLGPVSAQVAASLGVKQIPDQEPQRNLFVRSDQYSWVRVGVPALALKFAAVTPEEKAIQKAWLTERYHAPSDDLNQPINPDYAVAFNRYLEKLIVAVADAPVRPSWNADSFFRRFAK
ncbi:M28 family metallopeptidase [Sandaracinobacteroides hominis]|uniref:M28 family metallopeptidase n=1 Tax=Sandaracinobacteroides hominis TaxID=2780086 RepID=UPI0018F7307B|nr:M28 family metallopeptidase [Sandaracinobacteroides hominis]